MTDILRRHLAPIADGAWQEIERQGMRTLKGNLSGRKLVDFCGPHGWDFAAVNLGRLDTDSGEAQDGLAWGVRKVLPLVEIRVPFSLGIWALDDMARGAKNPDLAPMEAAARKVGPRSITSTGPPITIAPITWCWTRSPASPSGRGRST